MVEFIPLPPYLFDKYRFGQFYKNEPVPTTNPYMDNNFPRGTVANQARTNRFNINVLKNKDALKYDLVKQVTQKKKRYILISFFIGCPRKRSRTTRYWRV